MKKTIFILVSVDGIAYYPTLRSALEDATDGDSIFEVVNVYATQYGPCEVVERPKDQLIRAS